MTCTKAPSAPPGRPRDTGRKEAVVASELNSVPPQPPPHGGRWGRLRPDEYGPGRPPPTLARFGRRPERSGQQDAVPCYRAARGHSPPRGEKGAPPTDLREWAGVVATPAFRPAVSDGHGSPEIRTTERRPVMGRRHTGALPGWTGAAVRPPRHTRCRSRRPLVGRTGTAA